MTGLSTVEFLSYLRGLNVKVFVDHDRLRINAPPGIVTANLKEELTARKVEIIQFLGGIPLNARMQPPPIESMPPDSEAELSFAQERLWLLDQLEPTITAYNIAMLFRLKGDLNRAVLQQSLTELMRRHEVLRTRYVRDDGRPLQCVAPLEPVQIAIVDLTASLEASRHAEAASLLSARIAQPFGLGRDLPFRASLFVLGGREHGLLLEIHHIAFDGWSAGLLVRELGLLYNAFRCGQPSPLPDLPIQYVDFAAWQRSWLRGEVLQTQLDYWKEKLGGSLPVLQLPTDRARPVTKTYKGTLVGFELPKWLTYALRKLSRQEGVTLFVILLAAFKVLLLRYTGEEDILVGTPISNRRRPELEDLIGFFVNTLVMRTDLSGDPEFRTLLQRVQDMALGAYAHQDLPFERLVEELRPERDASRAAIFQVMFTFLNTSTPRLELTGLEPVRLEYLNTSAKFDLCLDIEETEERLVGAWSFNADLFDKSTVERMAEHYLNLLEGIAANPNQRLSALPLLGEKEQTQLVAGWNDTKVDVPGNISLQEWFEEQVQQAPNAVAVVFDNSSITYCGLNEKANQLAHELRKLGAGPDQLVGVYVERSIDMIVALLAVVKSGAAYVPLDPDLPAGRVSYMMEDSAMQILLTQRSLKSTLSGFAGTIIEMDGGEWQSNSRGTPSIMVTGENLAYVIYTSGSTGKPKGVQIPRKALTNFLSSMKQSLKLEMRQATLAATTISFDIAGLEIWLPLLTGGQVVVVSRETAANGEDLAEVIRRQNVRMAQATPVTWQLLLNSGWAGKSDMLAICGGEAMPKEVAAQLRPRVGRLWNLYGPTETTIWSTGYLVEQGEGPILIGRPIANTQCYILDGRRQPVPVGVAGELYIGGHGLARGYLNRPELTEEKFVANPFVPGERMYRTGDLARYRVDGNIECLGRTDHQVKIRGYRIELGEIESVQNNYPGVRQSVVIAREDRPGDKRLVAYLMPHPGEQIDVAGLKSVLNKQLPKYMIPAAFVNLDVLPLTANNKLDRKRLLAPEESEQQDAQQEKSRIAPRNDLEQAILDIWTQVLGTSQVGVTDNFFDLGGHSLLVLKVASAVRNELGVDLKLGVLFDHPTIEQLALAIEEKALDAMSEQELAALREGTTN